MALTQFLYDPFTEFDRLFDDAFTSRFRPDSDESRPTTIRPKMDLIEKKDNQVVARGTVNVEVRNDRLTVSGEKKTEASPDEGRFVVRERTYGRFARTLQLPEGTKHEQVQAKMDNGVLNVTFPKAPPGQEPKSVRIEASQQASTTGKETGAKK
ncbi:HSP20-like chaperone [Suillus lakei]|nr:HSP20-like chaperone [Suillus lakei]